MSGLKQLPQISRSVLVRKTLEKARMINDLVATTKKILKYQINLTDVQILMVS